MASNDKVLTAKLNLASLTELGQVKSRNIEKYKAELQRVATLFKQGAAGLSPRNQWPGDRLQGGQTKLKRYELESRNIRKTLQSAQ